MADSSLDARTDDMANPPPKYTRALADALVAQFAQLNPVPGVRVVTLLADRANPFAARPTDRPQTFSAGTKFRITVSAKSAASDESVTWEEVYVEQVRAGTSSRHLLHGNRERAVRLPKNRSDALDTPTCRALWFLEVLALCEVKDTTLGDVLTDNSGGWTPAAEHILGVLMDRGLVSLADVQQAQATLCAMDADNDDTCPEFHGFSRRHGLRS